MCENSTQHAYREPRLLGSNLGPELALGMSALALPFSLSLQEGHIGAATGWANNSIGPAMRDHSGLADRIRVASLAQIVFKSDQSAPRLESGLSKTRCGDTYTQPT
jgi:hypothetical protein